MRTSEEVNAGIERINSLLSEISSIGWDICDYFDERYGVEDYQYDEKVTDENELAIIRHALNCGMIETWNEFGFGQLVMPDDNKQKDAIDKLSGCGRTEK